MRLNWGNGFVFKNERQYYETLGFLCKDEQIIKVYIEDNRKAGARGIQGRLRVNGYANYNYFPEALKCLFENSNDKRPSVTDYVRNLRDNHGFNRVVDPTGNNYTQWLYKTSLDDVKKTVPKPYLKDFMRGYNWNYKIDTRVLSTRNLLENAEKKKITIEGATRDQIVKRNKDIALSKDENKQVAVYDVFLSHSSLDKTLILSLVDLFVDAGYAVYVDWIEDEELDRSRVNVTTAQTLKKRMDCSGGLAYIATANTPNSKWCPWELGYFDGKKNEKCCILPVMEQGEYNGQEYLGLYPYLRYDKLGDAIQYDFWVYDQKTNKHITLKDWLDGQKL